MILKKQVENTEQGKTSNKIGNIVYNGSKDRFSGHAGRLKQVVRYSGLHSKISSSNSKKDLIFAFGIQIY